MKPYLKKTWLLVICVALLGSAGCTTLVTVHGSPEAMAEKKIRPGAKVTLRYVSGHSEQTKLTEVGEDSLTGITSDGRTVKVAYADLHSLEHKKVDVLRTTGAVVGTAALTVVYVGAVAVGTMAAVADGG